MTQSNAMKSEEDELITLETSHLQGNFDIVRFYKLFEKQYGLCNSQGKLHGKITFPPRMSNGHIVYVEQ